MRVEFAPDARPMPAKLVVTTKAEQVEEDPVKAS
jgi:hypothetical protein